jgi:hypothetical protein
LISVESEFLSLHFTSFHHHLKRREKMSKKRWFYLLILTVLPPATYTNPALGQDCVVLNGFGGPYDMQAWSSTRITGGTTTITPPSGSTTRAEFSYNVNLGNPGGGVTFRTVTFSTTADHTGPVRFDRQYDYFHAFFRVSATFQVFADTSEGTNTITLVNSSSGSSQSFRGTATIEVKEGQEFGFIAGGSNFDRDSRLIGTLTISKFKAAYGPCTFTSCLGDFDADGDVDGTDLSNFASEFGRTDCLD